MAAYTMATDCHPILASPDPLEARQALRYWQVHLDSQQGHTSVLIYKPRPVSRMVLRTSRRSALPVDSWLPRFSHHVGVS